MDSAQYAELFLTESREHVSAINHALLELERGAGGGDEPVSAVFRAVHTIKGMSATMGYTAVAALSHELETVLDAMRQGARRVDPPLMELLFESADVLERAIEGAVAGAGDGVDVRPLVERLHAQLSRSADAPPGGGALLPPVGGPAPAGGTAPGGWTVPAPEGGGLLVRVRLEAGTPLRGVRAYLVVETAKRLGEVTAVSPPLVALQNDEFDHDFAFRLQTPLAGDVVRARLLAAGDIAEIAVGEDPRPLEMPAQTTEYNIAELALGTLDQGGGAAASAGESRAEGGRAPSAARSVRIDLRRLDNLMNLIGELVITRGRLVQLAAAVDDAALDETVGQASRLIADLQDEIMTSRMVPVWQVFDRFPRLVRDAARSVGKQVEFVVEGKDVELDRSMLDEVGDPIVHLLRNAIDHGLETAEERLRVGKPPAGRLTLSALRDRSAVAIRVIDDGRGIDRERVLAKARARGLVDATTTELSDEELLRIISRAGFSTAERVSDLSGRGVGIDAVYTRVRSLGGSVDIRTAAGEGTTVTLRLPLTLAIVRSLLASVGAEQYAVPMTHVSETVELRPAIVRSLKGREVLMLREEVLPVLRLRRLVGYEGPPKRGLEQVIVVDMAERRAALVVDALVGQQEIVVKQFDSVRGGSALFSGATILGDGAPALILDVASLL